MNRQFTRRRRDKGTQVTKRPTQTQCTKYGQKRVGLLHLLINSGVDEGTYITKQNLLKIIYDRRNTFLQHIPGFVYQCLRKIEELQRMQDNTEIMNEYTNNVLSVLINSSNIYYQVEKNMWILSEFISLKALRFVFHREYQRQFRTQQAFSLKDFPHKIQDFQLFKGNPPIAVINFGQRLVGLTVSLQKQQQKQLFNYQLSSKIQKYVIQKDSLFVLLKNGNIVYGKMGDQLQFLDNSKAKFGELKLCGSDVLVVTRSYVIKIITNTGNPKKIIRAGVQLSNVIPIYISTNMYVLMAEQQGKNCLLNCYKSCKNNYIQACPEGLQKIQQTLYFGKWILLRTQTNKIYIFNLIKDTPVRIFEIYDGILPGMLKILHRKLIQN